jgi:hypothetical protein
MRLALIFSILILIIVSGLFYFVFWGSPPDIEFGNETLEDKVGDLIPLTACIELGCDLDTIYVGSVNSDKYYECDCRYAKAVLPDNIACFDSDEDAVSQGYTKSDC